MTINEAIKLAEKKLKQHKELQNWKVTTNFRKRSFGLCSYTNREIQLSSYLIPECTDESIMDTIIHEIAHALTPGHNHDRIWKSKCIELGGNGQRCGKADNFIDGKEGREIVLQKIAKYTLTCPVCGEKYFKHRKPKTSKGCGMHGGGYKAEYKLILTQNY